MERRATQSKIAGETYSYSPACLGREADADLPAETDRHEWDIYILFARGAYGGIQLDGEGLKRLKLKQQEMDGAINH